jgi:hypothetical protein
MNIQSTFLLAAVIAAFVAAAVWSYRHRGSCGCSGSGKNCRAAGNKSCNKDCEGCPYSMFENLDR